MSDPKNANITAAEVTAFAKRLYAAGLRTEAALARRHAARLAISPKQYTAGQQLLATDLDLVIVETQMLTRAYNGFVSEHPTTLPGYTLEHVALLIRGHDPTRSDSPFYRYDQEWLREFPEEAAARLGSPAKATRKENRGPDEDVVARSNTLFGDARVVKTDDGFRLELANGTTQPMMDVGTGGKVILDGPHSYAERTLLFGTAPTRAYHREAAARELLWAIQADGKAVPASIARDAPHIVGKTKRERLLAYVREQYDEEQRRGLLPTATDAVKTRAAARRGYLADVANRLTGEVAGRAVNDGPSGRIAVFDEDR